MLKRKLFCASLGILSLLSLSACGANYSASNIKGVSNQTAKSTEATNQSQLKSINNTHCYGLDLPSNSFDPNSLYYVVFYNTNYPSGSYNVLASYQRNRAKHRPVLYKNLAHAGNRALASKLDVKSVPARVDFVLSRRGHIIYYHKTSQLDGDWISHY